MFIFYQLSTHYCFRIGVDVAGKYKIMLDSDSAEFGGHERLNHSTEYLTMNEGFANRRHSLMVSFFLL